MEIEKKWNLTKLLALPILVFVVMQYQIDKVEDEHAQQYYQSLIQEVQGQMYRLEQDMHIEFQDMRKETEQIFYELDKVREIGHES